MLTLLATFVVSILAIEAYSSLPGIARKMVRIAARVWPGDEEVYEEEWLALLDDLAATGDRSVRCLIWASGLLLSATWHRLHSTDPRPVAWRLARPFLIAAPTGIGGTAFGVALHDPAYVNWTMVWYVALGYYVAGFIGISINPDIDDDEVAWGVSFIGLLSIFSPLQLAIYPMLVGWSAWAWLLRFAHWRAGDHTIDRPEEDQPTALRRKSVEEC
ncbi:MAG: hypothetical protein AAGA65_19815 [Actinomycetota bacterium]